MALRLSSFVGTIEASAETAPAWHRVDKSTLFLHDLTVGQATFVAAMVVAPDGTLTSEIAALNPVKFAPIGSKITAAKAEEAVAMESVLDGQIVMNSGEQIVIAYFQTADGLAELRLLPGEGVAVGEMPENAARRYRWGCRCVCNHGGVLHDDAIMYCDDVFPQHPDGEGCDCQELMNTPCWFMSDEEVMVKGKIDGCKSGMLPVI